MYKNLLKPVLDFIISLSALVLLSPVFILTSMFLLLYNKGKPFFFQKRPGKNGKLFNFVKFRTMKDIYNEKGDLLPDKNRITKAGKLLRTTSLDEIPQLINVLKGDMSLVGPRPLLVSYLPQYNEIQARRHEALPGITGWAQINGRNAISWEQKLEYDVWYIDHISFILDMKIILRTILIVLTRQGINNSLSKTMEVFKGKN